MCLGLEFWSANIYALSLDSFLSHSNSFSRALQHFGLYNPKGVKTPYDQVWRIGKETVLILDFINTLIWFVNIYRENEVISNIFSNPKII